MWPPHQLATEPVITTVLRELKNQWPFAVGFAVTGTLIFNVARSITDEDVKNSKFTNPNAGHGH
jgi:hypothetical protein